MTHWRGLRRQWTREPVCGGDLARQICRRPNLELWCWAALRIHPGALERIPMVADLQPSWLILLHCATARANYLLRLVEPQSVSAYARAHDESIWACLCTLLHIDPVQGEDIRSCASLPQVLGRVGLRSAMRTSVSAYWACWADCVHLGLFDSWRATWTVRSCALKRLPPEC